MAVWPYLSARLRRSGVGLLCSFLHWSHSVFIDWHCRFLLRSAQGDWEEHAILLCNFFHWLDDGREDLESFIALGTGIPEGDTV